MMMRLIWFVPFAAFLFGCAQNVEPVTRTASDQVAEAKVDQDQAAQGNTLHFWVNNYGDRDMPGPEGMVIEGPPFPAEAGSASNAENTLGDSKAGLNMMSAITVNIGSTSAAQDGTTTGGSTTQTPTVSPTISPVQEPKTGISAQLGVGGQVNQTGAASGEGSSETTSTTEQDLTAQLNRMLDTPGGLEALRSALIPEVLQRIFGGSPTTRPTE